MLQISFVQVVQQDNAFSNSHSKCVADASAFAAFAKKVQDEAKVLGGDKQLQLAKAEIEETSCVCFKDHWFEEDSMLLDIESFGGKSDLITIRRGYTQGWWALALRRFGREFRECRSNKGFNARERV